MHDIRKIMSVKRNRLYILCIGLFFLFFAGCASMSSKESSNEVQQEEAAPEASANSSQQKQITGIIVSGQDPSGSMDRILLTGNNQLEYTSIKQRDPLGIIFYFPETSFGKVRSQYTPSSDVIASIKTEMAPDQKGAKVEVDLKKDAAYDVKRDGNDIEISFESKAGMPLEETSVIGTTKATAPDAMGKGASADEMAIREPAKESIPQTGKKAVSSSALSVINRIDFSSEESGKSAVIIGTTAPVKYEISKISDKTLKVRLFNSRLPEFRRQRPLITTRFESALDRISPIQADQNETDIIIDLRELVPYRPVQEGNTITLNFDASSIAPRPMETAKLPQWQQALAGAAAPAEQSAIPAGSQPKSVIQSALTPEDETQAVEEEQPTKGLLPKKEYTGQKIALDFYETEIKNVFRILQQVSGQNYAIDRDVTGEVTISIEKPAPWDQILDLILQMNQLGKSEQGNIVRIARTSTLRAEEKATQAKLAAIRARQEEQKLLEPIETEFIPINYANAKGDILPQLKGLITPKRGRIDVDGRNNQLIIHDTRAVINQCKMVITKIDKVTPQVLIEARIVEVSENFTRELGVSWSAAGKDIYRNNLNGLYSYNVAMNTPFTSDSAGNSSTAVNLNFTRLSAWGTPIVLDATLKAMEQEGEGKIISSPKILTLDNKQAVIKQGVRVPYQELSTEGVPTTKYEDVDLSLTVTPHMTPDNRIAMKVATTKNEILSYSPLGQPVVSTNEANTDLLIDDGQTIVIGGIVKTTMNKTETGFPILKDIPLLGWFFKDDVTDTTKQELLVFMTPKIVKLEQKSLVNSDQEQE